MVENNGILEKTKPEELTVEKKKKSIWGALGKFIMYGGWVLLIVIGLVIAIVISIANSGSS